MARRLLLLLIIINDEDNVINVTAGHHLTYVFTVNGWDIYHIDDHASPEYISQMMTSCHHKSTAPEIRSGCL